MLAHSQITFDHDGREGLCTSAGKLVARSTDRPTDGERRKDDQSDENDKEEGRASRERGPGGSGREIINTVSNLVARRLISFWDRDSWRGTKNQRRNMICPSVWQTLFSMYFPDSSQGENRPTCRIRPLRLRKCVRALPPFFSLHFSPQN